MNRKQELQNLANGFDEIGEELMNIRRELQKIQNGLNELGDQHRSGQSNSKPILAKLRKAIRRKVEFVVNR